MAKRLKLNIGDIFTIPLSDNEVGFGQIISFPISKDQFIMVCFELKENKVGKYEVKKIIESPIIFLGYTVDALLYHNRWEIIGNYTNNIEDYVLPYHKIGIPPSDAFMTDYKGNKVAKISGEVFEQLGFKTSVSPIRFQNALKAHFGLQDWIEEDYNKILYSETLKSVEIAKLMVLDL